MIWALILKAAKWLAKVPWQVWASLVLLAIVYLYGENRRHLGQSQVQAQWDKEKSRVATQIAQLRSEKAKVTVKVEYRTREVIKEIKVKGDVREKIATQFVPVDSGNLSGGFRVFYDAAVTGTIPDPAAIPNANPVAITDVATNANTNYTLCHAAYAKVAKWQEWATAQCAKNPNGCPDGDEQL